MGYGFIRDELDVQLLILYGLHFFVQPILEPDLLEVIYVDNAFGYFDFAPAMQKLLERELVIRGGEPGYETFHITARGAKLIGEMENHLPSSVRDRSARAAMRVQARHLRDASIATEHHACGEDSYAVSLRIHEGDFDLIRVELQALGRRQCELIEQHFYKNAEDIYSGILHLLTPPEDPPLDFRGGQNK